MTLAPLLLLLAFAADVPSTAPATRPAVRIVLAGDSTMTEKAGWGPGLAVLLADDVELINLSRGGRSSRTFYDEGSWKKCLDARPDYVLIQFGHNDEPGTDRSTDREKEFPQNMRRYVAEARAAGIRPILVTPLVRRQFGDDGRIHSSLAGHAEIVRQIAREERVPVVELHDRSRRVCEALGKEACIALLSTEKSNGGYDGTHLTPPGARLMGAIVADELRTAVPELAGRIRAVAK